MTVSLQREACTPAGPPACPSTPAPGGYAQCAHRVCTFFQPPVLLARGSDLRVCEKNLKADCTYVVCAPYIPSRTARPSPMWSPPEQGPELRGGSHEKGAAPHRAAPPHLYFGITRVFYVAFGQLRFYVWTRSVASFINPTRCTYRKTLASALARSYRVSVARKAGPNPAISSVFTGLASSSGRFVGSDDVLCYSACSTGCSPLFRVFLAFRERFGFAGGRHEPHVTGEKIGKLPT